MPDFRPIGLCTCAVHLVAVLILCLPAPGAGQAGAISFAQQRLFAEEGTLSFTSIQIPLVRDGGTSGAVVVTITLTDMDDDFVADNIVTSFADGNAETMATALIRNDAIPETNETFVLTITEVSAGQIGALNSMQLIIRANDQPYGLLQFSMASLSVEALEPESAGGVGAMLTVTRGPGTFGTITVDFEVVPSMASFGMDDITPTRGQLEFTEGLAAATISLTVNPDSVPEPAELFLVRLLTPRGGAQLAAQDTTASVTIRANDAPISWAQPLTAVNEDVGFFQLTITRGLLSDGSMAGDLDVESTVTVTTNSGSASSGSDFSPISRSVTFPPGASSMTVPVTIIDDNLAEGDEMFTVVLSSPSSDAVLFPPSTATVLIRINDNAGGLVFFASPGPVIIGEDEQTVGRFIVRRTVGTFGNLTAEWQITSNQGSQLASSDFVPARGNITIFDGASDAFLDIMAFNDAVPEVSEGFTVELVRVVSEFGDLSDTSPRLASLIVAESDDVYGLLEWAADELLSVAGSAPRELRLAVNRTGDSIGIVAVEYSIVYLPPQSDTATLNFAGSIEFQGGQTLQDVSITLPNTAFLEVGGNFMATIENATLVGGVNFLTPPTSSPRVGSRSVVLVPVTEEATSGFISFASQSLQAQIAEPDSAPSTVDLTVTRTGSFGTATVTWAISASAGSTGASVMDVGASAGVVVIPNGADTATFPFTVRPDDIPEIDETFVVTLLLVNEDNQMIRTQQNEAIVTILANDNPSGIFSISNSTSGPFFLNEDTNRILIVTIVRSRGDLTQELIQHDLVGEPGEIAGGQGIAEFQPGERSKDITLFVTNDDIPEVNETFVLRIQPLSAGVVLAAPTSVDITVLANDDFAGIFSFNTSSLSSSIVEPSSNSTIGAESTAVLSVVREAGAFGRVEVYWEVTNPSADISPTSGTLVFLEGQRETSFEISSEPDDDPEGAETYNVALRSVSGEASLALSSTLATVTVLQNDDPIRFDSSFAQVREGDIATFTLIRGGQANGVAQVTYTVSYQTASSNDVMISPPGGMVAFAPGETRASIVVSVLDDDVPEEQELLALSLVSVSGDGVLVSPTQATVVVDLSDDPNGLFAFAEDSVMVVADEGDTVQLMVVRDGGSFGSVSLRWTIYSIQAESSSRSMASSTDIVPVTGIVSFVPGDQLQPIVLSVQDDSTPELAETFQVELTIQTSVPGARLDNDSSAFVLVRESDEPNGVLRFADGSTAVSIAEDVPPANMALGQARLSVERTFGTIGAVRALWEVFSVSDNILPNFVDLIFFGEQGASVGVATPRPNTATSALRFFGLPGSVVTVPVQYHPANITSGFTISVWLQPTPDANGMLLAKTSSSGLVYALSLVADGSNFLVRLTYQQSSNGQLLGASTAEVSLSQSALTDGTWHSLVVTVGQGMARFYADNTLIDSRTLLSSEIGDEEGVLTVGGQVSSNFYTGNLMDVRVYTGLLQPRQIEVISSDAVASSLSPISGYISYPEETSLATLTISSVDDTTPEPSEVFILSLTNVEGGARVSAARDTSIITLLKSDASNGVFGFASDSVASVLDEPGMATLAVNRSAGTFDSVTVTWEVREAASGMVAAQDFSPVSGRIVFEDGEDLQTFTITTLDENMPELNEDFVVVLTSAVSNDSGISSTSLSGASIDPARSQVMVTVTENDSPYGILQFSAVPIAPGQPVPLATVMPELMVGESDGSVTVYVVRAQGTEGTVTTEYFTSDGSATNLGLEPDYVSNAGQLSFGPGVTVQSFNVMLVDDTDPELAKTFFVNLTNPQGGSGVPGLDIGQAMAITIQPSDDAFGRFSFSPDSLSHIVAEQAGGVPVTFTVLRDGGTFGDVSVYWAVSQEDMQGPVLDVSPATGVVTFSEGERQQQFTLTVIDDLVPELQEVLTVELVNVTVGASISSVSAATITVRASDHPYGRFVFSPALRPLEGVAEGSRVEVVVTREFGALGQVMVDIQTVASQNIATNSAISGLLDVEQLNDDRQLATTDEDYDATSETLIFESGQTSSSFYINITEDLIPEIDEYLFALITRVSLNQDSLTSVDTSVLPSVSPGNDSLAIIIIAENDDARGVVQFSESTITTSEPSRDFIELRRTAGTFGNLQIRWEAIPGTASAADFSPQEGTVNIPAEVISVTLPIAVLEDSIPEFSEQFSVRLLSVSGGGRLGTLVTTTVNIQASDDPNGAFEFAIGSRALTVEEPEDGESPNQVTLTVQRVGGSLGVVSVSWRVISSNGDPSADILPVSGFLQFITEATQQSFVLSVLPDTLPELDEVYSIELVNATGGGNIGTFAVADITVPSNDGPYGVVTFSRAAATTMEVGDNGTSVATLTLSRSVGFFGDIRVLYNVQSADATTLALADGTPLLSYYDSPVSNLTLQSSALLQLVPGFVSLDGCGRRCLSERTCQAFSVAASSGVCRLYLATQTPDNEMPTEGADYYQKQQDRILPFYRLVASEGNDFTPVVGQSVIIPGGEAAATIPVTIIGDAVPELDESITVTLTRVEVVGEEVVGGGPILGDITEATLTILENDDPKGVFAITSSNGSPLVRVVEPDSSTSGITLRVERLRGDIGQVSVGWSVTDGTAQPGQDFIGTGATLLFEDGETQATIALVILADDVPEIDETLLVSLVSVSGGASIAPGQQGATTVVIDANDGVAGMVGLSALSRSAVVGEGETAMFEVVRRSSAMGVVQVYWEITGTANVSLEFVATQGTEIFQEGENSTFISVMVRADATPELAERYTLTLLEVRTISDAISSSSGAATLDSQATTATITIRASNNPHGEVAFQENSLFLTAQEGESPQFIIIRQFGTFGTIDVTYMAANGSVNELTGDASFATVGMDFISQEQTVRLEDGQQSAVITIPIIDDDAPELDEVFVVQLTSVDLVGGETTTLPPTLGSASTAEITISPSDNPSGVITFVQESYMVQEDVGRVDIVISREQGTVGRVSVVYFITNQQAMNGEDFMTEPLDDVVFVDGQDSATLSIPIVDDTEPEVEEEFCVGLRLPRDGAILGNLTLACVAILPNDNAYGVFSFSQDSLTTVIQETQGTPTTSNVAELRIIREAGLFGQVTVPFEVVPVGPEGAMLSDLSPNRGALLFNAGDEFRILQLEAVMDDIPELAELFSIVLLAPTNLGQLASNFTQATVGVLPNQDPQGVLQIAPTNLLPVNDGLSVEEDIQFINFEVSRSFGTFDEVSVMVQTTAGTATAAEGETITAGATQVFNTSSAAVAYSFVSSSGEQFLALGSASEAVLYGWRGVFTPIHTLSGDEVTGFTAFPAAGGDQILVVTNRGSAGNREVLSHVYRLTASEELTMIQNLSTAGASEVLSFQSPSSMDWYVVVANGEDNSGNPNVDSSLYRWSGTTLEPVQNLPTIGASAVTTYTIDGTLYLAVASFADTRSQVFVWNGNQFRLDHTFDTQQATDIAFLSQGPSLLVTSETVGLTILVQNENNRFVSNLTLPLQGPVKVDTVGAGDGALFVVTNRMGQAQMFFEGDTIMPIELTTVSLPMAQHVYPFATPSGETMLVAAGVSVGPQEVSIIFEASVIDTRNNDFYSKNLTLTFRPGESILYFAISIFDDAIPETEESFRVDLTMPTGGARIGQSSSSVITILTNNDAHGVIGFADNSASLILPEMEANFPVTLQVERSAGTFGSVIVNWELSGAHMAGEITPAAGQVTFADGVAMDTINLLIASDDIAELNEVTMVTLTTVVENGVSMGGDESRGASIAPGRSQAVITVQANDDPHGVVTWSPTRVVAEELEGANNVIQVTLVREFGAIGAVIISYTTEMVDMGVDRAQSLEDFIPATGDAIMSDGQSSTTISITVLPDNIPEPNERFIVNITDVRIANEADRQGSNTDSPRVNQTGQILEVVIRENDNNRGLLNFTEDSAVAEETFDAQITLSVIRTRGNFGSVSVEYAIIPGSATSADYSSSGELIVFASAQEAANITIDIINDQIPERDETFEVVLRNPMGGADIGMPSSVTVTILGNDDLNGVFFFADSSLLIVLTEDMGIASLSVIRGTSSAGEVTVYWEVATEGQLDLEPVSGNLTFQEGVTEQSFTVRAVQDGIPESFEAYPIRLVSIMGGGRIVDPQQSVIAIQASDDPTGILGLQQFPEGVIVNEGEILVVGVTREAGTAGTVTLTWDITPPDATVFATVQDTVVLVDGQSQATIIVQTLSDAIPEVTRRFTLQVVSVTMARVNVNASSVEVTVPASNNPHGTVEFLSSGSITTMEGASPLELSVVRTQGLIGDLRVNYTAILTSADAMDFSLSDQSIVIASEVSSGVIEIGITDDTLPELDETFSIMLTSVELLDVGDELTIPPTLGSATVVPITIEASDDPFGSVSLSQTMFTVEEGETLTLDLVRDGGTLGVVTVMYATVGGRARSPDDYTERSGSIVFAEGQTTAQINVPTIDDEVSEVVEDFSFELQSATGGSLGNMTRATIFIAPSDSPFGVVGFDASIVSSGVSIANPTGSSSRLVTLMVNRAGGVIGSTDITWRVTGPGDDGVPTADIPATSITGTLTLADGQRSTQLGIEVLPTSTDEQEEVFTVTLTFATNNVLIDSLLSSVQITVLQHGSPFGVVSFLGDAIRTQRVSEGTNISLSLGRNGDLASSVAVSFVVSRVDSTDPVLPDVTPAASTLTFPVLQGRADIVLSIVMDEVAEFDETFTVTLTGTTSGASINSQANTATFIVNANGSPLGEYGIANADIMLETSEGTISRSLVYTVVRRGADATTSDVVIQHSYSQDSTVNLVPPMITRSFPVSISQLQITLPLPQGSFLYPGSVLTIAVSNVTVSSPPGVAGMEADVSSVDGIFQVVVADEVANIVAGFAAQSLVANVDEAAAANNVMFTVFRRGQLGSAEVSWTTSASTTAGFIPGSLQPTTGVLTFPVQQNTTTLTLTATAAMPHGSAEEFRVSLIVSSLDQSFPSQVDSTSMTALIDPMGVIQIPGMSYSGLEGTTVSIPVWRRFGSMGSITVTGVASAVSASTLPAQVIPATPTTDFPSVPVSITLQEGVTTGFFNLTLFNNAIVSALKVFQFSLTSVSANSPLQSPAAAPRLSSVNTSTSVTIIDDEGGAGQFQLSPTTATLAEGAAFTFTVIRSGGTSGSVSALVQTVESGSATSGVDYQAFSQELLFTSGVSQLLMTVNIVDDNIPEGPEDFSVTLSVPGGDALVNPNANTLSVTIEASDNPAGVFSFLTASLVLSESGPTTGELEVRRIGNLAGVVAISWEALYTDGEEHAVPVDAFLLNSRGTITFGDNSATSDVNIVLELISNAVPANGEQFSVQLSSVTPGVGFGVPVQAVVTVQPRIVSTFILAFDNLTVVASTAQQVSLLIQRTGGLQTTAVITYNTTQPRQPVAVGSLTFEPAQPQIHFTQIQTTITFNPGDVSHLIEVPIISVPDSPAAFFVQISAAGHTITNGTSTVVISPPESITSLLSVYIDALDIITSQDLERVTSELLDLLSNQAVSGLDNQQTDYVQLIIETVIQKTLVPVNIDYSSSNYVSNMLDIFQNLLMDVSFSGRSQFVESIQNFAYSLVEDSLCNGPAITHSRPQYFLHAVVLSPPVLANTRFSSTTGSDYVQFPSQVVSTEMACFNVSYIEFSTNNFFMQPTFQSKVLSLSIQGVTITPSPSDPVIYRIYTDQRLGVIPDQDDCLLWRYPSISGTGEESGNQWDNSICVPQTHSVLQENFIQCACSELGDVAVASDLNIGYGWTFPAGISAALVIIAVILVLIIHFIYFSRTQLATRILMCLTFSVFLFQLILLVDIFASDSTGVSANGCAALGALLQFTAVAQFLWIAAMAIALWAHFVGCTSGNEPLAIYIVVTWGVAILIVVVTLLIGRFGANFELTSSDGLYGPIGDLCFVPHLSVSLLSIVLPVILSLLAMVALTSYTCFYWSRWEDVKSFYYDSFNRTEIPLVLGFFALIFLSSLAAYLHAYIGLTYTFGAFVILNTLEALYALVVYFFVSWHTLTRKHDKYKVGDELEVPGEEDNDYFGSLSLGTSLASSKEQLVSKDLQEESLGHSSPESGVVSIGMRPLNSDYSPHKSPYVPLGEESKDDSHMDDLLFMLKTQNFSPGSVGSDESEPSVVRRTNRSGAGSEHFERRRISIADTHL